jgi:nucleoredoxin
VRGEVEDKELEIVFVSSDRDAAGFDSYFKEMPWLALPFTAGAIKAKLASRFNVSGIPHFVVLGPNGLTKDANARATVSTFKGDVKAMLAKW